MTRRGSNLFELQATVLSLRMSPAPAPSAHPVAASRAKPAAPPAPVKPPGAPVRVVPPPALRARQAPAASGTRRTDGATAPVVAKSFDFGSPVAASPPYRGRAIPAPLAAGAFGAWGGGAVRVEPFSDDDFEPLGEETGDAGHAGDAGEGFDRLDEETPEDEGTGAPEEAPYRLAEESSRAAAFSPASAAAMAAVERDLAELARQLTPPAAGSGADAPAAREMDEGSAYAPAVQPAPAPAGGHRVFDEMAQGMAYATEFRLPPVAVKRLFSDLDRELDARDRSRDRARAAASSAPDMPPMRGIAATRPLPATPEVPEDVLLGDVSAMSPAAGGEAPSEAQALVSAALELSPHLRHFKPEEVVLTEDQATKVFRFFWPEKDLSGLGTPTLADREFAQALVLEALEASHDYSIIEYLAKKTLYKVYPTFDDVKDLVKDVAKEAVRKKWFSKADKKITADTLDNAVIYEAIRVVIALKFGTPVRERLNGLPLTY